MAPQCTKIKPQQCSAQTHISEHSTYKEGWLSQYNVQKSETHGWHRGLKISVYGALTKALDNERHKCFQLWATSSMTFQSPRFVLVGRKLARHNDDRLNKLDIVQRLHYTAINSCEQKEHQKFKQRSRTTWTVLLAKPRRLTTSIAPSWPAVACNNSELDPQNCQMITNQYAHTVTTNKAPLIWIGSYDNKTKNSEQYQ